MYQEIFKEAAALDAELISWRRALHENPELDLELPLTCAFVQEKLKEIEVPFEVTVNGSCVTGLIGKEGPCFLLRSDMDALPILEESGVSYASKNGYMHACGHDLHTAVLLGAAKLLKRHESALRGQVKLLFQPGEETFRGAAKAIECGVLREPKVEAAFAMHVSPTLPIGSIRYGENPQAAVYGFKITLTGSGGHGSAPELCVDPINTGVHIYLALQELIARECAASKEAALTVGQFESGSAPNIIPEAAVLQGTLRAFDEEVSQRLIKRIKEVVSNIAAAYRTKADLEVLYHVPSLICDRELNEEFAQCIGRIVPDAYLIPGYHEMASEDFAFISRQIPSSYFFIGAAVEDESKIYRQHNSKVQFNEKVMPLAAAIYTCAAIDWLNKYSSIPSQSSR